MDRLSTHKNIMNGFADELTKTADWEQAAKGLFFGALLGGGLGFGGSKLLVKLIEKNKDLAAMFGAMIGATMGGGMGAIMRGRIPQPPKMIESGTFTGLPEGVRYADYQ